MDNCKIVDIDVSVIQEFSASCKSFYSEDVLTSESGKVKRAFYTEWVVRVYRIDDFEKYHEVTNFRLRYEPTDEDLAFRLLAYEKEDEQVFCTVTKEHWIEF